MAPGFDELDALSVGAQAHYWVGDFMKVGVTTNTNEEGDVDSSLNGADITLRKSADSWLKVQASRSEGLVSSTLRSDDGGFGFAGPDTTSFVDAEADGYRADLSVGFKDLYSRAKGQLTVYAQELDWNSLGYLHQDLALDRPSYNAVRIVSGSWQDLWTKQ